MRTTWIAPLGAMVATVSALELNTRQDGPPRVVRFDLQRNYIRDPVANDAQRLGKRSKYVDMALYNGQALYSLNITVGTPGQKITVDVDTGSSDLWVNSPKSHFCKGKEDPCAPTGTYKANSSSTYSYLNSGFNISYAGGDGASGDYVTDTIQLGGQTIKAFQFGIGYTSTSPENILGIGYPDNEAQATQENQDPYDNLPARMAKDGLINTNAYSLWLDDVNATNGRILFGGVDQSQFEGKLVTLPIIKEQGVYAEFFVEATGVDWDGQSITDTGTSIPVLLDSGTSLTYLPDELASALFETVGAEFDRSQGATLVDCSLAQSNTNLTLHFGNSLSINVPASELVLSTLSSRQDGSSNDSSSGSSSDSNNSQVQACLFGISPAGQAGSSILGDTFLRSAYVVFDMANNEISMAQSNVNAGREEVIVEIGTGQNGVQQAATASATATITVTESGAPSETGGGNNNAAAGLTPPRGGLMASFGLTMAGVLFGALI